MRTPVPKSPDSDTSNRFRYWRASGPWQLDSQEEPTTGHSWPAGAASTLCSGVVVGPLHSAPNATILNAGDGQPLNSSAISHGSASELFGGVGFATGSIAALIWPMAGPSIEYPLVGFAGTAGHIGALFPAWTCPHGWKFWAFDRPHSDDRVTAIDLRLDDLRAQAEEEGRTWSEESRRDLLRFTAASRSVLRPSIFLLENGFFRAVWKSVDGRHLGLQFRGGNEVQYVFFARRKGSSTITRSAGRDNLQGITQIIDAHDLRDLLAA
jgi:hypothetical protein